MNNFTGLTVAEGVFEESSVQGLERLNEMIESNDTSLRKVVW